MKTKVIITQIKTNRVQGLLPHVQKLEGSNEVKNFFSKKLLKYVTEII